MKKSLILFAGLLFSTLCNAQQWEHSFYMDEFGDKTQDDYVGIFIDDGNFSNSATSNSPLTVQIHLTLEKIIFDLHEYQSGPPIGKGLDSDNTSYTLFLKVEEAEGLHSGIQRIKLYALKNHLAISKNFGEEWEKEIDYNIFINILKKSNYFLKCYILIEDSYFTIKYNFVINPNGFTAAYKMLN